jgi:hypothetical protein
VAERRRKVHTGELGCVRVGVKLTRRFVLIVSETQEQADKHVQAVASFLDGAGVERAVNKYGTSRGWRRDQLRTANGFNVAGYGLDAAARGVKLDEFRPDLIIFDDIDSQNDSPETVAKKIGSITKAIIPAGSSDCAILFLQNMIHEAGIVSQLVDGRADFLHNREVPTVEKAVNGLKGHFETQADGTRRYRITEGEATWEGQSLETCEQQINEWGFEAFDQEAQHNVAQAGGVFFKEWNPSVHVVDYAEHAGAFYGPDELPDWWPRIAALDWGYSHPSLFLWGAVHPEGIVYVYREVRVAGKHVDGDDGLLELFREKNDGAMALAAGPDIFTMQAKVHGGPTIAQQFMEGFTRGDGVRVPGIGMINPTQGKKRRHQAIQMRKYLQWDDGAGAVMLGRPLLRIFRDRCPNLIEQIPKMLKDDRDPESILKVNVDDKGRGGDDAVDAGCYLLMQRPWIGSNPAVEKPDWMSPAAVDYEREREATKRKRQGMY